MDSNLLVYQRYVGPLTRDEREAYWQDFRAARRAVRPAPASDTPHDLDAFEDYMRGMLALRRPRTSTDEARELAVDIVMRPPVPLQLLGRCASSSTRSRSACCRPRSGACTASAGTRCAPRRSAAAQEYLRRLVVPLLPDRLRLSPSARG